MDQNPEMPSASAPKSNKEEHEKILAALRKEFDYDTGASGKDHYQQICRTLEAIENSSKHGFRWPRAQEQKDQLLAEKAQYETTPELMNYPGSFAEQVQLGVANIVKHKLNKNIPDLPQKINRSMRRWGLDAQWIKDKLNLDSSQIHAFVNTKKPKTSITSFFLEVFCLITFTDPYDLLDLRYLQKPTNFPSIVIPPVNPIIPDDEEKMAYFNFIMSRFADPHDSDRLLRLRTITKIAKLKAEKYQVFQYMVSQIPVLSKALSAPLPDLAMSSMDEKFQTYLKEANIKYALTDTPNKTQPYCIIAEADQFLRYLIRFDMDRIKALAHFANADDTVWRVLIAILIDGGFPAKSTSLRSKAEDFSV